MKSIELNDLLINARFSEQVKVGFTKDEIEKVLDLKLGNPNIETPDISLYYTELKSGYVISLMFDNSGVCYEINLDLEENKGIKFFISLDQSIKEVDEDTSFEDLLSVIASLDVGWRFDARRVYLQTVCLLLDNGLRLYYALGNKKEHDYGLFSIKLIMEDHELNTRS